MHRFTYVAYTPPRYRHARGAEGRGWARERPNAHPDWVADGLMAAYHSRITELNGVFLRLKKSTQSFQDLTLQKQQPAATEVIYAPVPTAGRVRNYRLRE